MSSMSLEERRAERRRRRQQEDESGTKSADEIHAEIQERLARRRKERDEQLASLTTSVATVNGEDDLERRRRERREQRLRPSGDTENSAPADDYSSRRNRRRGTDEDITEDKPKAIEEPVVNNVPDNSEEDAAEERRRRQRQEEEEEARRQAEREEEEERQRQAALEEERRREEKRRREEEERREEERRQAEEEEERRRKEDEAEFESGSDRSIEDDRNKLFINEDDIDNTAEVDVNKLERVQKWNEDSQNVKRNESDNVRKWNKIEQTGDESINISTKSDRNTSLKEINNNKIKDKLDKFEHLKEESDSKTPKDKTVFIPVVEKDGLKGKLQKFEQEIKEQELAKDSSRTPSHPEKKEFLTPQVHKLTDKLQQFEIAAKSQSVKKSSSGNVQFELGKIGRTRTKRQALLGRWSTSESVLTRTDIGDVPKKSVLDRWKSAEKETQETSPTKSSVEKPAHLSKRLSGNTEFIASRFLEKASKSIDESASPVPKTPTSSHRISFTSPFDQRRTSQSSETQSDVSDDFHGYQNQSRSKVTARWPHQEPQSDVSDDLLGNQSQSRSKVTDRWPYQEAQYVEAEIVQSNQSKAESAPHQSRGKVTSRWPYQGETTTIDSQKEAHNLQKFNGESSADNTFSHSRGSSIDTSSETSRRSSQQNQEEEEEEERLRKEKEKKPSRMAAEDGGKKRGKRKGLGGLTPEKKKKLKDFIADVEYDEEELEEKERELANRVQPLPDDLNYLSTAELRKLITNLHSRLAQIHSEAYDTEFKLNKQEKEIVDLNMKISDSKGKFAKPVLRKVNKTEQNFAKMSKKAKDKEDFRETLKSAHDDDDN